MIFATKKKFQLIFFCIKTVFRFWVKKKIWPKTLWNFFRAVTPGLSVPFAPKGAKQPKWDPSWLCPREDLTDPPPQLRFEIFIWRIWSLEALKRVRNFVWGLYDNFGVFLTVRPLWDLENFQKIKNLFLVLNDSRPSETFANKIWGPLVLELHDF